MADNDQSGNMVRQHQRLAVKGGDPQEGGDFGVGPMGNPVGGEKPPRGHLKEHQRGIARPRGFHPEPDHGEY